jgi:hypothetical protein
LLVIAWLENADDGPAGHFELFAGDNTAALEAVQDPDGVFADAHFSDAAFLGDRVVIVGEKAGAAFVWVWSPDS